MVNLDHYFFNKIQKNNQRNYIFAPIWIYEVEKLFVKGSYYLKIYLIVTKTAIEDLQSINFYLHLEDGVENTEVYEFQSISNIKNKHAKGCVVKVSKKTA